MNQAHCLFSIIFQIGPENHRHLEVKPAERVFCSHRDCIHTAILILLNDSAFIHESVSKTAVPCKNQRATDHSLHIVQFDNLGLDFHINLHNISTLPFAADFHISVVRHTVLSLPVHCHGKLAFRPGRYPQSEAELRHFAGIETQADLPVHRIACLNLHTHRVATRCKRSLHRQIEID